MALARTRDVWPWASYVASQRRINPLVGEERTENIKGNFTAHQFLGLFLLGSFFSFAGNESGRFSAKVWCFKENVGFHP